MKRNKNIKKRGGGQEIRDESERVEKKERIIEEI